MNHPQSYIDYQPHMSAGHAPPPQTVTSHYQQHPQPPLLQPGPGTYSPSQGSYPYGGYSNGMTSPQSGGHQVSAPLAGTQMSSQLLPLPAMAPNAQSPPGQAQYQQQPAFDMTGQIAPAGMKPRVTATLWEDEGSLCFQVEARGVCVARREDNHMINGTKLLNVAGMTRGRRDGILKSEKLRHVVKIGPMHLKGVWIPFERALDFANKEKITELLYPLFVHNIGALLYHPTNQNRANAVMAAAERRRLEGSNMRGAQASQLPSLHQQHHLHSPIASNLPGPPHTIAPHPGVGPVGRPSLERAHTFPTPPTSASSIMGTMGSSDSFQWNSQNMGSVQGAQSLSIDTGLSNARSLPTTPASTPPGTAIGSMQQYQQGGQPYDNSRSLYSAPPPQQSQYAQTPPQQSQYSQQNVTQQNIARFGQPSQYIKSEMGPPSARAPGATDGPEQHDQKSADGLPGHVIGNQGNGQMGHGAGEEEAEHEHDNEYTHDNVNANNAAYNANRGPYNTYNPGAPVSALAGEHVPHLSEMTGSPNQTQQQQSGTPSGRATPRNASAAQTHWTQQQSGGYSTPPTAHAPPSSNLYNVMSSERGTANGGSQESYSAPVMPTGYTPQQPAVNGSNKRMRDDDDDGSRPTSRGPVGDDIDGLKRRKTVREGSIPSTGAFERDMNINRARSSIVQRRR